MKSIFRLFTFCLIGLAALSYQSNAQFFLGKQKAKLTGFRVNLGGSSDIYNNLSGEGLFSMLKPNQTANFDISQYREVDYGYGAEMTGGHLGFDLTFSPKHSDGTVKTNRELRLGVNLNIEREILIDMAPLSQTGNWLGLCVIENNFNLNLAYLFKAKLGPLEVYTGPAANVGGTFGNDFIFMGSGDNTFYQAYSSNYVRVSGVAGFGLNIWRVNFQAEGSYGIGSQLVHNGDINLLRSYSLQLSMGYKFK